MASDQNQDNACRKPRSYYVDYTNKFGSRDRRKAQTNNYRSNNSRYKEAPDIAFGNRGFLMTSIDEVKSYLEMRNVLEGIFEQVYSDTTTKSGSEQNTVKTTEDELESELMQLRQNRPFKQVKTHCRNTLFINILHSFSHIDPVLLVDKFFDELAEKRQLRTTNTFKVLPILDTFRNSAACAKESISTLMQTVFKDVQGPKKYFIEFQTRGNYKLNPDDKQNIIEGVAEAIAQVKSDWSVSREDADYMIVLTSLKNVCCLAIVMNYFKRAKYNVVEFCKDFVPDPTSVMDQEGDEADQTSEIDQNKSEEQVSKVDSDKN